MNTSDYRLERFNDEYQQAIMASGKPKLAEIEAVVVDLLENPDTVPDRSELWPLVSYVRSRLAANDVPLNYLLGKNLISILDSLSEDGAEEEDDDDVTDEDEDIGDLDQFAEELDQAMKLYDQLVQRGAFSFTYSCSERIPAESEEAFRKRAFLCFFSHLYKTAGKTKGQSFVHIITATLPMTFRHFHLNVSAIRPDECDAEVSVRMPHLTFPPLRITVPFSTAESSHDGQK